MFRAIFRVLFGFVLACLGAGMTKVMFALGTQEVLSGDPDRISAVAVLSALAGTHSAVFAAPFAFLAAAISEWQGIRSLFYHLFVGIAIAMAGFTAQYFAEAPGALSIFNSYAASAYGATGAVGGFLYWMFAGRRAGHPYDLYDVADAAPARPAAAPAAAPAAKTPTPAAPAAPAASVPATPSVKSPPPPAPSTKS